MKEEVSQMSIPIHLDTKVLMYQAKAKIQSEYSKHVSNEDLIKECLKLYLKTKGGNNDRKRKD